MAKQKPRKRVKPAKPKTETAVLQQTVLPERLKEYLARYNFLDVRKEPRLLALLFCDYINTTGDDKVNLLGVFDRIWVHREGRLSPRFVVFGRVAEAFKSPLWLTVLDPDNEPKAEIRFDPPKMPSDRDPNLPNQIQFMLYTRMKFDKDGTYWFDISYEGNSLGGAGLAIGHIEGGAVDATTDTFT